MVESVKKYEEAPCENLSSGMVSRVKGSSGIAENGLQNCPRCEKRISRLPLNAVSVPREHASGVSVPAAVTRNPAGFPLQGTTGTIFPGGMPAR